MTENFKKDNDGVNESGRTMMEMLGTLAIIGVLSIGGVSGYGRAVNAYRANTIVDTAQKKAMMTSHELTTGSTVTPDISNSMKTPSGYQVTESTSTGTTGDITPDTKYFGVEVGDTTNGGKAVPVEVAKNLLEKALDSWKYVYGFGVKSADGRGNVSWVTKTGSGTGGIDDAIGNNQTVIIILVYAADLSLRPGTLLDGAQFTDGGQAGNTCTPTCVTGATCQNGECVCDNGNVYLSYNEGTECDTETPDMECSSNQDCASAEKCEAGAGKCYCKLTGEWLSGKCGITGGTCETLDVGTEKSYVHDGKTTKFLLGEDMSWWAAENWCKAHHMSLVKASTLGCTISGFSGSCPSQVYSDMNTTGLDNRYWTVDRYNSCTAWVVAVGGKLFSSGLRYANYYPLCE